MLSAAAILRSSNEYEVPRPPRRGSHRPGIAALCSRQSMNVAPQGRAWSTHAPVLDASSRYDPIESLYPSARSPHAYDTPTTTVSSRQSQRGTASPPLATKERSFASELLRPARPFMSTKAGMKKLQTPTAAAAPLSFALPINSQQALELYTQTIPLSASCQSVQKRCQYPSCTKISVSRGLCRGHGGGRRCHVVGCTKSAQSRSNFCWAHGGGQRCDVTGCMRSRKSKHYCSAHLQYETETMGKQATDLRPAVEATASKHRATKATALATTKATRHFLPSLGQALTLALNSTPNLPLRTGVA